MSSSKTRLFLAVFIIFLGLATSTWASITWNPNQLAVGITPGTLQVVRVQFSTDTDLSNATVRIVPELAPFISSDVTSFSQLNVGNQYELTLMVSLPRAFMSAGVQGTIHILDKNTNATISQPLPISITAVPPAQTAASAPTTVALPSNDRISSDPDLHTAAAFVNDEVDVLFASSADSSTIDSVAHAINGAFLGSVPALHYYQILVNPTDFNGLLGLINTLEQNSAVASANFHFIYKPLLFPADPGADLSYSPALINLAKAWDITTGVRAFSNGNQLKIGVIDTVFDYNHVDLMANIAYHTQNNAAISSSQHGTRVASIVGAVANNNIGIAGVMWNSSLYLYSAGTAAGQNDGALLTQRISQAIADQVRVVNWSIGGGCSVCTAKDLAAIAGDQKTYLQLFGGAGKNVLWVMAAGNDSAPLQQTSAEVADLLSNVIAVSAVDSSGSLASFSDYGVGVIAAPGVEVYSDIPGGGYDNGTSCFLGICFDNGQASGTSLAAPHVTGVAGLMLSINPNLSATQLKQIIQSTATHTGKFDPVGDEVLLLDAYRGVQQAQALIANKAFAFAANNFGTWSYGIDATTGALTPIINPLTGSPGFTTPGEAPAPISVVTDPVGNYVYVANLGLLSSNGTVSGYSIASATGLLTPVSGSPFAAGPGPISAAIHPLGKFLYVGNELGGISAYTIDGATGTLTPIPGSPFPFSPVRLAIDPFGKFLFGTGANVMTFQIDQNTGALTLSSSAPASSGAVGAAVDPTGKFLYVADIGGGLFGYTVNSTTGALTAISGSPFPGTPEGWSVAVDPSSKFAYVANPNPSNSISAYTIDSTTGALTPVAGSPYPTLGCPDSVAVDSSDRFVYVAETCGANDILGFSLNPSSGALTPIVGSPFPSGIQPFSIAIK